MCFFGKSKKSEWDEMNDRFEEFEREKNSRHGLVTYQEYNFELDQMVTFETHYKHGMKHGNTKTYYEHGQLFEDGNFIDDVPHGPVTTYHEDGQVRVKGQYEHGKMHGKWLVGKMDYIDSNGKLHCKEFIDTLDHGEFISSTDTDRDDIERRRQHYNNIKHK